MKINRNGIYYFSDNDKFIFILPLFLVESPSKTSTRNFDLRSNSKNSLDKKEYFKTKKFNSIKITILVFSILFYKSIILCSLLNNKYLM